MKVGKYSGNKHAGHKPKQKNIPKSDYPEMAKMAEQGYMWSEIGKKFGCQGTRASILVRRYLNDTQT